MEIDHKTTTANNSAKEKAKREKTSQSEAACPPVDASQTPQLLAGGGEMGERIRTFDWSKTPLGPIDSWSPALLTTVRILLVNRFPILLCWGPEYISFYNDAYIPLLGKKHPSALGQPVHECWKEIWSILQPLIDTPFHGGPATWDDDLMLEMNRYSFTEETHFTIAYSPVPDDSTPDGIGGVLAIAHEITEKVVEERRIVALRDLGARVGEPRTAEEACRIAAETMAGHNRDIPFALLYLVEEDGKHARLAGAAGVPMNDEISPIRVDLDAVHEQGWPLARVRRTETLERVTLKEHFSSLPPGPWSDAPIQAVVTPIPSNQSHEPAGLMVAGVSARLSFDQLYQDFIDLVRTQIATAIANARVHEEQRPDAEALAEIDRTRRQAEEAIQYRSAEFETLLNQAPLGVFLVDADFRIREVNPAARPTFADTPDLIGRDLDEVMHILWNRKYADEVVQIFRHTLETGEPYETPERFEYRLDRGVYEYYQWRLDRIPLPDGRFGVVCYFRDLSDQARAQATIAESEERYRGIVNQSVGAIAEADPSGRFTTVNDRFCEMTGYTRAELLQMRMQDLTHPGDRLQSQELLGRLVSEGIPYEIEKRYIRKDGSIIWVHKSVSAIREPGGTAVRSLIMVLIDMTKSKQVELALQQLNLQLENLVQERTSELQAANQSLREEISGRIRVEKELSLHRDRLRQLSRRLVEVQEEERRAIARELHDRAGQVLSALNINLTIMSQQLSEESKERIGARMSDSMKLATEVISLIRIVVSDLRPTVLYDYGLEAALASYIREYQSRYGIKIRLDQPRTPLPRLEPHISMTILRILQESLTNIVRHARASKVRVAIGLAGDKIRLTIQDDGVGIAGVPVTEHSGSHGLNIMRERAEAFGGTVSVRPATQKGTRVEVFIPIQGYTSSGASQDPNSVIDI